MATSTSSRQELTLLADQLIEQGGINYYKANADDKVPWVIVSPPALSAIDEFWFATKEEAAQVWIQLKIQGKL